MRFRHVHPCAGTERTDDGNYLVDFICDVILGTNAMKHINFGPAYMAQANRDTLVSAAEQGVLECSQDVPANKLVRVFRQIMKSRIDFTEEMLLEISHDAGDAASQIARADWPIREGL